MKSVIIAKPKSWLKFKPSMCKSCWATCCHAMPVQVSVPDLIRLGYLSEETASSDLLNVALKLQKAGVIKTFKKNALVFVLEQKENLDCIFLNKDRGCTVYAKRPEICRQFPKIGPRPGYCPYLENKIAKS